MDRAPRLAASPFTTAPKASLRLVHPPMLESFISGGENHRSFLERPMHLRFAHRYAAFALTLALAACAPVEPGAPMMPGSVNAPPPPMAVAGDALLTETLWSWKETVMSGNKRITPDASDRYTLLFQPGGMVSVRADCNRGSATYTLNGASLSLGPVALTRAMCPPGSRDTEFLAGLSAVSGQVFRGNDLTLTLKDGSGTMVFTPQRQ